MATEPLKRRRRVSPGRISFIKAFLTFYGLARLREVLFLFSIMGALGCGVAEAQIAPGPLSKVHANLGGLLNCTSCHGLLGRGLKCLECHDEIRRRVEARRGYHSLAFNKSGGDCAQCHREHSGAESPLIHLDRDGFEHGIQTGFTLEGSHRKLKCERCHTASKITAAGRSEIKLKDLNRSFLGLSRSCTACHQEPHQNQLGTDCLRCHDQAAWIPASKFSHSRTEFPLTGLHQKVSCDQCHVSVRAAHVADAPGQNPSGEKGSSQKTLLFKGLSFGGCENCHTGPHGDTFATLKSGGRCEKCHETSGWRSNDSAGNFDHGLTGFRLSGKHRDLSCDQCHKDAEFSRPIAHELCRSCHEDEHAGQFDSRSAGSDCSACHSTASFTPSLFSRDDHMQTDFPLEGKHATLPCVKCHQAGGSKARYKIGKTGCDRCHPDPHGGEFASAPYNNKCNLCHTPAGFEFTTFTRERHATTEFPLTGRHTELACGDCHKPRPVISKSANGVPGEAASAVSMAGADADPSPKAPYEFRFASHDCDTCHSDPHGLNPRKNLPCKTCHIPQQLNAPLPFDHSRAGVKLEGPHLDASRSLDCIQCHRASGQARAVGAKDAPDFSGTSAGCSGCHREKDVHGDQFDYPESRKKDCSSCHTPDAWSAGIFNHEDTPFILNGVHLKVACANCHDQVKNINGRAVRVYRGTPSECLGCH